MILASPVWKTAPPTMKSPIIITTAELEKPARASEGVSTLVTSNRASEQSATMSDLTLSAMNAAMVRANVATTMMICPESDDRKVVI